MGAQRERLGPEARGAMKPKKQTDEAQRSTRELFAAPSPLQELITSRRGRARAALLVRSATRRPRCLPVPSTAILCHSRMHPVSRRTSCSLARASNSRSSWIADDDGSRRIGMSVAFARDVGTDARPLVRPKHPNQRLVIGRPPAFDATPMRAQGAVGALRTIQGCSRRETLTAGRVRAIPRQSGAAAIGTFERVTVLR